MLAGHYGPALALHRWRPEVPLWVLLVGVQAVDIAWAVFVLTGVEHSRLVEGITASNDLDLYDVPLSHGLVATGAWGLAAFGAWRLGGGRAAAAVAVALAVVSHWLLDLPMHRPDLPLWGSDGLKFGLGLWFHREWSFLAEVASIALGAGALAYGRGLATRERVLVAVLFGLAVAGYYGPAPREMVGITVSALGIYLAVPGVVFRRHSSAM